MSDQTPPTPPTPPAPPTSAAPAGPLSPEQDKLFASLSHAIPGGLAALALLFTLIAGGWLIQFVGFGIFAGFSWVMILAVAAPAVFYFVFGPRGAWTKQESLEALNFQIWIVGIHIVVGIIGAIVSNPLAYAGLGGAVVFLNILGVINLALLAASIFFSLQGYLAVNKGGAYRYPVTPIRFVK